MVLVNVHIGYYTELYTKFTGIFDQNKDSSFKYKTKVG